MPLLTVSLSMAYGWTAHQKQAAGAPADMGLYWIITDPDGLIVRRKSGQPARWSTLQGAEWGAWTDTKRWTRHDAHERFYRWRRAMVGR